MADNAEEIATWMLGQLRKNGELYQEDAVEEIARRFGSKFVYENDNGNLAINREVLVAFRRLTENSVVWSRGERLWRWREQYDPPSARQTE